MVNPKIPPSDDTAEQSVLGAILIDKDAMIDVSEFLRPEHFYRDSHGYIFDSMLKLYEDHEPIDVVTVTAELKKQGKLKEAGGATAVNDLLNAVPTSAHAEKYGRIVKDL